MDDSIILVNNNLNEDEKAKIIAYMLAKEAGDPNFAKLKKYTALRKECIKKIMDKYGPKEKKEIDMTPFYELEPVKDFCTSFKPKENDEFLLSVGVELWKIKIEKVLTNHRYKCKLYNTIGDIKVFVSENILDDYFFFVNQNEIVKVKED